MGAESGDQCREDGASYVWTWTVAATSKSTRSLRSPAQSLGHLTGTGNAEVVPTKLNLKTERIN